MRAGKGVFALFLAALALPGCGAGSDEAAPTSTRPPVTVGSDERGVLDTIDRLQTASHRGDGQRICEHVFTPRLVRSIEKASGRSCPVEVRTRLFKSDESIAVQRGVQVIGRTATVVIREQNGAISTLHMIKRSGRWRIGRLTPQGAP